MSQTMQNIDARTRLAGTNRLEVLLFSLGRSNDDEQEEWFGINVFKVREVMHIPEITRAPDMPKAVEGMATLRGQTLPIINLASYCGIDSAKPPGILIITEYNQQTQGFLVYQVDTIERLSWEEVKAPPAMLTVRHGGLINAVTELKSKGLIMIMDVEKVLADCSGIYDEGSLYEGIRPHQDNNQRTVLFADDSSVARAQVSRTLEKLDIQGIETQNGREAWEQLQELAELADDADEPLTQRVNLILTDIEMPEMDGFVLTQKVKSDERFKDIPVIMHSSLSGTANQQLGQSVGADGFVSKFQPKELAAAMDKVFLQELM